MQSASPKTKEICQAVADGLNYYLAVNPQVKPRLITHFEPWHPLAFRRFILYQSFIYGKSGLQAADILSAVQEIHDNKVGAVAFPADLRAELAAIEQDRAKHVGARRLQHVGRPSATSRRRAKRSCSSIRTSLSSARDSGMKGTW